MNYYNEYDRNAAAWLRELISAGLIPAGHVDERSIADVTANDIRGFTQCHFFAGIGGWPLALQLAGWPAYRPVWTGSCPCQPFSSAGKQRGQSDERHLWPEFFRLIRECRPDTVFGEQVASAVGFGWLDGISTDLEAEGYAFGAVVLGAHSASAPHIRQRLYWVANASSNGSTAGIPGQERSKQEGKSGESDNRSGELDFWRDSIWLPCRDGKARSVKPGLQLLVDGIPAGVVPGSDPSEQEAKATKEARVMRLKGYGNAIVPQVAAEFIKACL